MGTDWSFSLARLAEQRLNACMNLVASMASTEGDEFASDFLLAAAHAAEEAGVPVHKSVKERAIPSMSLCLFV